MPGSVETSIAQVGLRDFLFYVAPGSVLLLGILGFAGVSPSSLDSYSGIASSLAGLLLSYVLGQCAYPAAYIVRGLMNRVGKLKDLEGEAEGSFIEAYQRIARTQHTYFAIEVFRYRTLARFCSLMIAPLILCWSGTVFGGWGLANRTKWAISVLAALIVAGFLWRYFRYEKRYREAVSTRPDE